MPNRGFGRPLASPSRSCACTVVTTRACPAHGHPQARAAKRPCALPDTGTPRHSVASRGERARAQARSNPGSRAPRRGRARPQARPHGQAPPHRGRCEPGHGRARPGHARVGALKRRRPRRMRGLGAVGARRDHGLASWHEKRERGGRRRRRRVGWGGTIREDEQERGRPGGWDPRAGGGGWERARRRLGFGRARLRGSGMGRSWAMRPSAGGGPGKGGSAGPRARPFPFLSYSFLIFCSFLFFPPFQIEFPIKRMLHKITHPTK
jgi:hypothetical protein